MFQIFILPKLWALKRHKDLRVFCYQPEDAGRYICIATNEVGQDRGTVTLSVQTHPVFTELLGDVALKKGERLLLACGVNGIPTPHITWAFNNNIVPGIDSHVTLKNGILVKFFICCSAVLVHYDHMSSHSELVIERVSKEDSGTYTCVAENSVGTIKSLGFVSVLGENKET